jgi:hypothetical protein
MASRRGYVVVGTMLAGMIAAVVGCLSDPRESDAVVVTGTCDRAQLSSDPTNAQATLKAYLESADLLVDVTNQVEAQLKDACNAVGADLALPPGADPASACRPGAARADDVSKNGGRPVPGYPHWVEVLYPATCKAAPGALEQCLSTCAGPCDGTKCDAPMQAGTCQGTCTGQCVTKGDNAACKGSCVGEFDIPPPVPATCKGQTNGVCTAPVWAGECAGACAGFFTGACEGTCTGQCNGQPINPQPAPDAGAPDAGDPDAGEGGAPEAGGPPPGGPPPLNPPPTNADGNCKGFCVGVCSKGSNGFCANAPCLDFKPMAAPDLAHFSGGNCAQYDGLTIGHCTAAGGSGTTTTCTGECTQNKPQCEGTCVGGCQGTLATPTCRGTLKCNQNTECQNACAARALLKTTCEEAKSVEVYAISDPALAGALKKSAPKLGKASTELANLREVLGNIRGRAYGDFVALGLRGDLVRACVAEGNQKINGAEAKITTMISVDPSTRKFQQ